MVLLIKRGFVWRNVGDKNIKKEILQVFQLEYWVQNAITDEAVIR